MSVLGWGFRKYPLKYLGDLISDSRVTVRQQQVDKARGKLAGWKADVLSQAGRFTLVQAVLQALPIHCLSAGWTATTILNRLDQINRSFLSGPKLFPYQLGCCYQKFGGLAQDWHVS